MRLGNWNRGRLRGSGARPISGSAAVLSLMLVAGCAADRPQATTQAHPAPSMGRPASYAPPGPPGDPWGPWIREASRRFDVPERWIREVMRQESAGRASATSHAGAMGLMQVMPGTYRELRSRYALGDDPYHPYDSIMAGTAYIREMYELYGSPAFLAAYNAGPRRLEDYLWNNRGLPNETRTYVSRIGPGIVGHHPTRRAPPEVYAAAEIPLSIPAGPRRMDGATMLALREQRNQADPGVQPTVLAGPVRRMDPIPDGSTTPAPVPYQVAAVGPVVRMDPIPDGSTPQGAARLADVGRSEGTQAAPPFAPPAPPVLTAAPAAPRLVASAGAAPLASRGALALPPPVPRQPPVQLASAATPAVRAGAPSTSAPARLGFGVLGTAQAASRPGAPLAAPVGVGRASAPGRAPAAGGRAVQVGAFTTESQARTAAGAARDAARVLGSRVVVEPVGSGRATLYRARVDGLNPPQAQAVCDRLRARGACTVVR